MNKYLLTLILALSAFGMSAQQVQQLRRSKGKFLLPEFKEAKILQPFGRFTTAKANISIKAGDLCFMDGDTIKVAVVNRIVGVEFNDTLRFRNVNGHMARIVKADGYNELLCLTTVDKKILQNEAEMSYLNVNSSIREAFEVNQREEDKGYPLEDEFYFYLKGNTILANETNVKHAIDKKQKANFKSLMKNRLWSWRDPESLAMLLPLFPK